jgi:hypothetical protein
MRREEKRFRYVTGTVAGGTTTVWFTGQGLTTAEECFMYKKKY